MAASSAHKQAYSPARPMRWAGVLLSLGIGALLYALAASSVQHDAHNRFSHQARNAQYNIASRIKAYTEVLRGTASFFQASEQVDRDSFHRYVEGLQLPQHFPALDNINYARYGRAGERAGREQLALIEPLAPFRDRLGDAIASTPQADAARDSGTLSVSAQPIGGQQKADQPWLAMRLPLYRNNLPLRDAAQRRAAYLGSVGIDFSLHRLVRAALLEMPEHKMQLALYDGGALNQTALEREVALAPGVDQLLFDSRHDAGGAAAPGSDRFCITLPLDFNGRLWKVTFCAPKGEWISRFDAFLPWLALLTGFSGSMLIYMLFHTLASSRSRAIHMAKAMTKELRDSQSKLQLSHHKLRRLAAHADQIKEQERKRIAREIHDDLGQNLLVLRIEADMLATRTRHRHPRLHARASSTLGQIDSTIKSVRNIINDLRPTVLDLGLSAAVEWQIAQFRARSGIVCELIDEQNDISISDHCATAFFRVLQESLSNILQHAGASLVRVELRQNGAMLTMTISDNGVGLRDTSRNKLGSFGLVGIEERVSILGGHCAIRGQPNGGTTVTISVPVAYQPAPPYPEAMEHAVPH